MRRILCGAASLVIAGLAACQTGQGETPQAPQAAAANGSPGHPRTSPDIAGADISARITALASDYFQGRGPGSPAGEQAADWIAAEMERIGLQPGNHGSYFQEVPAVEITLDPARSNLEIHGPAAKDVWKPAFADEVVYWTRHAAGERQAIESSPLVFVGYGVSAPEESWDDFAGLDVKGKTLVVFINDPGFITSDASLFKGKAMTYYGRWTYKYEEAARRGAAAVLIVHETEPAGYAWQVVRNSNTGPKSHLDTPEHDMGRATLEGWITTDTARKLFASAGLDYAAQRLAANRRGFKAIPMKGLSLSATLQSKLKPMKTRNVVGVLPGTSTPEEYFLYTAHWDHLGVKPGVPGPDKIHNGALDNASGVAGILEIAEKVTHESKPRRSIGFVAWTLEEQGLLGSEYFADHPIVPVKQIVAGDNIDGLMAEGRARDLVVVGSGASDLETVLTDVLKSQQRVIAPDPEPEKGYYYRSDHINLARKGVPMLYTANGLDLVVGGKAAGQALRDDYRVQRYHQPSDEFDPSWDQTGPVDDLEALHELGRRIANDGSWPSWLEGSEFRAIRDKSLTGK
ncbi:MAG TPA: M28 family peptidase [Kofleriaceae bacterium]|nr:M28 family peptidase [Kofleriaceae bacterium]